MPKVNKTIHGDLNEIAEKIKDGITCFGTHITCRDSWTTEAGGVKCVVQIYEKLALELQKAHYSMAVVLFDTGNEIRVYGTTSGGSNQYWGNPYPDGEGELTSVLGTVLGALDNII